MLIIDRALSKIIHNAVKFTDKGYIHITVQDVSREAVLPAGYDNSIKMSTVSIDIKDSGCGSGFMFLPRVKKNRLTAIQCRPIFGQRSLGAVC